MTLAEHDALWAELSLRWQERYANASRETLLADLADLKERRKHYCVNCLTEREVRIECIEAVLSREGGVER